MLNVSKGKPVIKSIKWLHKWAGLTAFLWLSFMGISGFITNHPEWRWPWHITVSKAFGDNSFLESRAEGYLIQQMQVNPKNTNEIIGGSPIGFWRTADKGNTWTKVDFETIDDQPIIWTVLPSHHDKWEVLWLGTDDGIWMVNGGSGSAIPIGLQGHQVTSLDLGIEENELVGVLSKSKIFRFDTDNPATVDWLEISNLNISTLPEKLLAMRFIADLHLGFGMSDNFMSKFVNDFGGLAIFFLAFTGFYYWLLQKLWRLYPERRKKIGNKGMRFRVKWTYNFHAPIFGVIASLAILPTAVSALFLNHMIGSITLLDDVQLSRKALPDIYSVKKLDGLIEYLVTDPIDPKHIMLMIRLGIIETFDEGQTWIYSEEQPIKANQEMIRPSLIHREDITVIGSPNRVNHHRIDGSTKWNAIEKYKQKPWSIAPVKDGWIIKSFLGFYHRDYDGNEKKMDIKNPKVGGLPLFRFLSDVHQGDLMGEHWWKWINDYMAIATILLCFSGVISWWTRKWF